MSAMVKGLRSAVKVRSDMIPIPVEFWHLVDPSELNVETSKLGRRGCLLLWEMLGRNDPCPRSLTVYVNADDANARTEEMKKERPQ